MCSPYVYDGFIRFRLEKQTDCSPSSVQGFAEGGQLGSKLLNKVSSSSLVGQKNNFEHGHFISLSSDLLGSWKLLLTGLFVPISPCVGQTLARIVPLLFPLGSARPTVLPQLDFDKHCSEARNELKSFPSAGFILDPVEY